MLKILPLLLLVACVETEEKPLVLCDVEVTCDDVTLPTPLLGACADTADEALAITTEKLRPALDGCATVVFAARCKVTTDTCPN